MWRNHSNVIKEITLFKEPDIITFDQHYFDNIRQLLFDKVEDLLFPMTEPGIPNNTMVAAKTILAYKRTIELLWLEHLGVNNNVKYFFVVTILSK